jgi:hypothetical protein
MVGILREATRRSPDPSHCLSAYAVSALCCDILWGKLPRIAPRAPLCADAHMSWVNGPVRQKRQALDRPAWPQDMHHRRSGTLLRLPWQQLPQTRALCIVAGVTDDGFDAPTTSVPGFGARSAPTWGAGDQAVPGIEDVGMTAPWVDETVVRVTVCVMAHWTPRLCLDPPFAPHTSCQ